MRRLADYRFEWVLPGHVLRLADSMRNPAEALACLSRNPAFPSRTLPQIDSFDPFKAH